MISLRDLEPRDLGAVRELLSQLAEHASGWQDPGQAGTEATLAAMRDAPGQYANWVAVDGERVVGFLSLVFYKTLFHQGGTALINELVVARDMRGKGVGRMLVQRAVSEAKQRGMDEIEVGTEKGNAAARRLYAACGFDAEYVLLGMEFTQGGEG